MRPFFYPVSSTCRSLRFAALKKALFYLLVFLLVAAILELFSFLILSAVPDFQRSDVSSGIASEGSDAGEAAGSMRRKPDFMLRHVLHPYIGYVSRFDKKGGDAYGFRNSEDSLQKRAPDKVIIAVTGGSFATGFFNEGTSKVREELNRSGQFGDKDIIFLRFSLGGYKQPQPLMILNYMLSLGAEFDYVLNIDGYNDLALPATENIPAGVFPFYPRMWQFYVNPLSDSRTLQSVLEIHKIREMGHQIESLLGFFLLRRSFTGTLLWKILEKRMAAREAEMTARIASVRARGFESRGPRWKYQNDEAMYRDIAGVWKRSSLLMKALCDANGIRYLHFLQPNQYVAGSKPLTEEERKFAYAPDHPRSKAAADGYPYLVQAGGELRRSGEAFYDLTTIYADDHRTRYKDNCCHVNEAGMAVVAESVSRAILENAALQAAG